MQGAEEVEPELEAIQQGPAGPEPLLFAQERANGGVLEAGAVKPAGAPLLRRWHGSRRPRPQPSRERFPSIFLAPGKSHLQCLHVTRTRICQSGRVRVAWLELIQVEVVVDGLAGVLKKGALGIEAPVSWRVQERVHLFDALQRDLSDAVKLGDGPLDQSLEVGLAGFGVFALLPLGALRMQAQGDVLDMRILKVGQRRVDGLVCVNDDVQDLVVVCAPVAVQAEPPCASSKRGKVGQNTPVLLGPNELKGSFVALEYTLVDVNGVKVYVGDAERAKGDKGAQC